MQLVESGKVALDVPVQRYLPTFRVADPAASAQITVRHLLQHTSGIPDTECDTRTGAVALEQYVAELQTVQLDRPVGASHEYCSGNYNVLGRIIEVVAGESYGDYMHEHVFAPLQMRHTYTSEQEAQQYGPVLGSLILGTLHGANNGTGALVHGWGGQFTNPSASVLGDMMLLVWAMVVMSVTSSRRQIVG
jgi:CubicO group peptidase (beta-lactamase class C family)